MQETNLKDKYETIIKNLKSSSEEKLKHITFLQEDTENKNKLLNDTKNELSLLRKDFDQQNKELTSAKEELAFLKAQLSMLEERGNSGQNDWSLVDKSRDRTPKVPEVLLVGTSNISKIDPKKLSTKFNIVKKTAFTIEEACKTINELEPNYNPDVIALHVLSNDLKIYSSNDCVSELQSLIQKTKNRKPKAKILVSLATNRSDEKKHNLKVNTINSMVKELHEESDDFVICDNCNLSNASEINKKFISSDGVHLSEEGVKVLASNIRKCVDNIIGIPYTPRRRPNQPRRWKRGQNDGK